MRTLDQCAIRSQRVLVRVDLNVPQDDAGVITDDTRIRAALPTLRFLLERGSRVALMSHLGRPKGADARWTLLPVAVRLSELLGSTVALAADCVGPAAEAAVATLAPGQAVLLENVRFHREEEKNDPAFAAQLARLGDLYVNDAFGTAHRAHASTEGVARLLPNAAGFLLQKEIEELGAVLHHPERPFAAILGGAKVADKIGVIDNLLPRVDMVLIGGGMAYTFLKAQGREIGRSLLDTEHLEAAKRTLAAAAAAGKRLLLPVDVVVTDDFKAPTVVETVSVDGIAPDRMGVDIGPATIRLFCDALGDARTVVWNGPMGVFERPEFAAGTRAIAEALAGITDRGANTIIGGGDSAAAVEQVGLSDRIAHISTGGGASLEFLEGRILPGVAALG